MTIDLDMAARSLRLRLTDKNFLALASAGAPPGVRVRSQLEMDATLRDILLRHPRGQDFHVFGYGSLMWNPGLEHTARFKARVHGWHRSFCIRTLVGRGAPETPGLMLALDRGGSCHGMLIRIPAHKVNDELTILWRREMSWGSYEARWVRAWSGTVPIPAVTFVVNRHQHRYVMGLQPREAARFISTGCGSLGTCRSYFDMTLGRLRDLAIVDREMERLDALLRRM